jgi:hypothetical protein
VFSGETLTLLNSTISANPDFSPRG